MLQFVIKCHTVAEASQSVLLREVLYPDNSVAHTLHRIHEGLFDATEEQ